MFDVMTKLVHWLPSFKPKYGIQPLSVIALLLSFLMVPAHAEVWTAVDAKGVPHFASERLNDRYQLLTPRDAASNDGTASDALIATVDATDIDLTPMGDALDVLPAYQAVKQHVQEAAAAHQIDYELLQAIIATESGFDARAVSPGGAAGLMQLMPATAKRFGVRGDKNQSVTQKLTNPRVNIQTGSRYLRYLLDRFSGQVDLALAAYNAGEGNVQRAGNRIPNFKQTQRYVKTVLALYTALKPTLSASFHSSSPQPRGMVAARPAVTRPNLSSWASITPPTATSPIETDKIQ